jgi:hypothetical protein
MPSFFGWLIAGAPMAALCSGDSRQIFRGISGSAQ